MYNITFDHNAERVRDSVLVNGKTLESYIEKVAKDSKAFNNKANAFMKEEMPEECTDGVRCNIITKSDKLTESEKITMLYIIGRRNQVPTLKQAAMVAEADTFSRVCEELMQEMDTPETPPGRNIHFIATLEASIFPE